MVALCLMVAPLEEVQTQSGSGRSDEVGDALSLDAEMWTWVRPYLVMMEMWTWSGHAVMIDVDLVRDALS
ncbi:hypothetical protein AVEN_5830-1 [Araneus ventricosus]|uniref:Uncharacterized protein n=1 Tax=Araneus ventricosus TaxID=182803 RepID=A0A4Y2L1J2_ARAVE|nr:hypothetical protein AVEN_5830-1 [Araneus ventricosus]